MYLHAYQSYIWNLLVSYRLQQHRHAVVVGDLVVPDRAAIDLVSKGAIEDAIDGNLPQVTGDISEDRATAASVEIKAIETEEEAAKYTIFDVVIPLPGHSITYPPNCLTKIKELMTEDGLDPEDMRRPQKDFSLTGAYRNVVSRAQDLTWLVGIATWRSLCLFLTRRSFQAVGHVYCSHGRRVCQ